MATRRDGATAGAQKVAEMSVGDLNQRYLVVQRYFYEGGREGGGFTPRIRMGFRLLCNCLRAKNISDVKSINS